MLSPRVQRARLVFGCHPSVERTRWVEPPSWCETDLSRLTRGPVAVLEARRRRAPSVRASLCHSGRSNLVGLPTDLFTSPTNSVPARVVPRLGRREAGCGRQGLDSPKSDGVGGVRG